MSTPAPIAPKASFGPFELDAASGELLKSGIPIKLQPQPFRILQLLIARGGTVVTREEIQHLLWNGSVFVDFEHGINFSINQIRAALSDNAEKPRYVETLPRRGYRFIAQVEREEIPPPQATVLVAPPVLIDPKTHYHGDGTAPLATVLPQPPAKRFATTPRLVVAGVLLALSVAFIVFFGFSGTPRVSRITQLTFSGKLDPYGPITTDGSRLFYLEREGDHWNSMEVATSGGESQPLRSPFPNTRILAISPDRSKLLVAPFTRREGDLPVWVMPLIGGAPRRMGNLTANDASFSPDGKQIALAKTGSIFLADLDGSSVRQIASTPGENRFIGWSPDGKLLRFTQYDSVAGTSSLWEVTPQGRNLRPVLLPFPDSKYQCCGRWSSDGAYYFFTAWRNENSELWVLKNPGAGLSWLRPKLVRLTSTPVLYTDALPTEQGRIVYAFGGSEERFDLASLDLRTSQTKPLLPGSRAIAAEYSPDGQWLVYFTRGALWRSRPDGTERLQLATSSQSLGIVFPRWSPDSKSILFTDKKDGVNQIYIVSAAGGPLHPILAPDHQRDDPDWSWDGQGIVFSIGEAPRAGQVSSNGIYLYDLRTAQTTKLPDSSDVSVVRPSPDGRLLAILSEDQKTLMLYDLQTRQWSQPGKGNLLSHPHWSADSRSIYFQDILASGEPVYRFRLQDSSLERVHTFEDVLRNGAIRCGFMGLAPDGSLLIQLGKGDGNLYKLELDLP